MVSLVLRSMTAEIAGGGGDPPPPLWIKVRGGNAIKYQKQVLEDVSDLLDKVKERVKPKLDNVATDDLTLHEFEGGAASSAI